MNEEKPNENNNQSVDMEKINQMLPELYAAYKKQFEETYQNSLSSTSSEPPQEEKLPEKQAYGGVVSGDRIGRSLINVDGSVDIGTVGEKETRPNKTEKINKTFSQYKSLIIGAVVVIVLFLAGFFIARSIYKKDLSVVKPETKEIFENKVNLKNHLFTIEKDFSYRSTNDLLTIFAKDRNWQADINILDINYDNIINNKVGVKGAINQSMTSIGTSVGEISKKTIKDVQFVVMEIVDANGSKAAILFNQSPEGKTIATLFSLKGGEIDYDLIGIIVPILNSVAFQENDIIISDTIVLPENYNVGKVIEERLKK